MMRQRVLGLLLALAVGLGAVSAPACYGEESPTQQDGGGNGGGNGGGGNGGGGNGGY